MPEPQTDPFAAYAVSDTDPFAAFAVEAPPKKAPPSMGRQLAKAALNTLPGIGGIVGGVLSTPETLGAGTVPGVALGVGAGQGLRDLIGHFTGLDDPTTPLEKAGHIAKETAVAGATGYLLPGLVEAAKTPIQTLREASAQFGEAMPPVVRRLGRLLPSLPTPAKGPILTRPAWQTWEQAGPMFDEAAPAATTATTTAARPVAAGLSEVERAALQKQGYPADVIAKIEAAATSATPPASVPAPVTAATPSMAITGATDAAPAVADATLARSAQPALQGPRIRTGAERVGREAGMTKEAVRQATGPVLDEAVGEASPIVPKNVLGRMIDDLKAMPPGSPEREAYVARATSGKTKWQVENIRRTLEHLGLIVPAAVGLEAMRGELLQRMRSRALDQ